MSQILNSNDLKTCLILIQIGAFAVIFSYSKILGLFLQILALSQIGCCCDKQVEFKKKYKTPVRKYFLQ